MQTPLTSLCLREPFTAISIALSLDQDVRLQQRQNYHKNNDKSNSNEIYEMEFINAL